MRATDAKEKFVNDFVAAWTKVMNADRFDLAVKPAQTGGWVRFGDHCRGGTTAERPRSGRGVCDGACHAREGGHPALTYAREVLDPRIRGDDKDGYFSPSTAPCASLSASGCGMAMTL